jgi:hypothetical protein
MKFFHNHRNRIETWRTCIRLEWSHQDCTENKKKLNIVFSQKLRLIFNKGNKH